MPILDLNWMRWDAVKKSKVVGWPLPVTPTDLYAYQKIAADAGEYASVGFDKTLFFPSTLGAAGVFSGGYDKKDDYLFDGTAWGQGAMLFAAIKALHKAGVKAYGDLVLHQYDGYPNQQYRTVRFPKTPTCFAAVAGQKSYPGNVSPDSVPDPAGGWPDGDLAAYAQPDKYMWNGAIAAALNQITTFGFDGFRFDEAKDLHAPFLCDLVDKLRKTHPELFFVGEYFDGSNFALGGWVNYWMNRRASVFDFGFKFNVGTICNNNSNTWMGRLAEIGYCIVDSEKAVTFVENADTDTSPGEQTIWNKQLGHDIMLTFPGEPMVYYRDWATDANCYGMKPGINNGLWIWKHLAQGGFVVRNAEYQTFSHERLGYGEAPGCICFFNNDQWNSHTVTVQTRYGNNVRLHEYTGHGGYSTDKWTDWQGKITVTIPRNVNGCNSLVYGEYL